ncbi:MAG: hypothetical protein K2Q15_07650 [Burkholderiales bacterium]|nr:hypothetical protein [Burkholderiales bacterium]
MEKISDRLLIVISEKTDERKRWKTLEGISGISSGAWQNFWRGKQRPTAEMLEALGRNWPEYAFWLTTGLTDPMRGHIAPQTLKSGFPVVRGKLQTFAVQEWQHKLELMRNNAADTASEDEKRTRREELGLLLKTEADVPPVFGSYEEVMKLYGEAGSYQYVELVLDDELHRIEDMRLHEERALIEAKLGWEKNLKYSIVIDSFMKKGKKTVMSIRDWFLPKV